MASRCRPPASRFRMWARKGNRIDPVTLLQGPGRQVVKHFDAYGSIVNAVGQDTWRAADGCSAVVLAVVLTMLWRRRKRVTRERDRQREIDRGTSIYRE